MSQFVQEGNVLDYTPGADVAAGDIVDLGGMIGIAPYDIAANETGSVTIEGVVEAPRVAATPFIQGAFCYWDGTEVTAVATDSPMGVAAYASASGDATIKVKLTPGAGTPTA